MESKRQLQTAELVKRHFSHVMMAESPNLFQDVMITVTHVKMSSDLGLAKIYLSIFNTEHKQAVLLELERHSVRFRQLLAHRLRHHVRRIPHINMFFDDTLDEMEHLNALFDRLHDEDQMGSAEEE